MSYYMEVSSCPTLPLSWVPNCPVPNCPVSKCPVSSCPVSSCPGFPADTQNDPLHVLGPVSKWSLDETVQVETVAQAQTLGL